MGGRSERAADAPEQKIGEHSKGNAAFKPTSFAKSYPHAVAMVPEKVGVNQVHLDEMIQVSWTMREPLLEGIRAKVSVANSVAAAAPDGEAARVTTRPGPQGRPPPEGLRGSLRGISLLANTCRRAASQARPPTSPPGYP